MAKNININHFFVNHTVILCKNGNMNRSKALEILDKQLSPMLKKYHNIVKDNEFCFLNTLNKAIESFNPNYRKEGYEGKNKISFVPWFSMILRQEVLNFNKKKKLLQKLNGFLSLTPILDKANGEEDLSEKSAKLIRSECNEMKNRQILQHNKDFIEFVSHNLPSIPKKVIEMFSNGYTGEEITLALGYPRSSGMMRVSRMKKVIRIALPMIMANWRYENGI